MIARLVFAGVFFAGTVGVSLVSAPPTAVASALPSPATQSKGKAAPKPNAFKVQVRHPGWKRTAAPNAAAASNIARVVRANGWPVVQIQHPRSNVFVVRARMPQWRNRAVVTNPATAQALANRGRSQGFQARVVPFHW